MALIPGTKLGPYEVVSAIGAGGMGEVYRAKDTRLDRTVAIKVLPSHLSADPERKQRFDREARTISSLNHPHICTLHDIGHQDGVDYLVMEYVEGESLAQRLEKGPLTTELVLRYGIQIAEALHKAHRQGIVHRDLKPGNIMLTKSGTKLLDFGLAKYQEAKAPTPGQSQMETKYDPLTEEGVVLGTVQYMAPEQLEGKETDSRTDIFALGEVLYEMATGQRTFKGTSKAQVMAAILTSEPPPISTVQPLAPPPLDHVVKECLAKDPDDRWQSAHDVGSELKWIAESGLQASLATQPPRAGAAKYLWPILSAILLLVSLFFAYRPLFSKRESSDVTRVSVLPPENVVVPSVAISPDGQQIAFTATTREGTTSLWMRTLNAFESHELAGTDGAQLPFWSTDSRFVAFFAGGKLKKIPAGGGQVQILCPAPNPRGGSWSTRGEILFAPDAHDGLYRISEAGGSVTPATTLDRGHQERTHRWPFFLPDGKHFLFVDETPQKGIDGTYIASLDSKEKKQLLPDVSSVGYASGYLVFMRNTELQAQPFDVNQLRLTGEPMAIASQVPLNFDQGGYAAFSISQNGTLAYSSTAVPDAQLTWFDRAGRRLGTVGSPGQSAAVTLSPDGKKVLVSRHSPSSSVWDIWKADIERNTFSRLTSDPRGAYYSIWSPDGSRVAFSSERSHTMDLFETDAAGTQGDRPLLLSSNNKTPVDWSPDGKYILYDDTDPGTQSDLWLLPHDGDRKPVPFLKTEFNETGGQFSPDRKLVAYTSDETGRDEVYARTFPNAAGTGKWQISTEGGAGPRWRRDGKELFYIWGRKFMAVQVKEAPTVEFSTPSLLFEARDAGALSGLPYAVSADGQRFLVNATVPETTVAPINVLFRWPALLKR
jgi:serine/threonine protein kinase/dipeptidyl aminopeptidase/acylaminoacyl peptidase